jgi:transcriptional regulator with XRE-family HTH domain
METNPIDRILERVVMARKQAGLSQGQAAKLLGFASGSALSMIESGQRELSVVLMLAMCRIYHVSQIWMLTGTNPNFDPSSLDEVVSRLGNMTEEVQQIISLLESQPTNPEGH